jgi:O-antigen biosynthesis protein
MKVVIPFANNPTDLSVLLMQLQCQTLLPEAIYVADNSKDGLGLKIVRRYQWSVPIVVDSKVGSIYKSWNEGMRFARGDVLILNDDVLIPLDFCKIMNDFLKSDRAALYCPTTAGFPPVRSIRKGYKWNDSRSTSFFWIEKPNYPYVPTMTGWCFGVPKKTIDTIGYFDTAFENWYGDKDYEERILRAGERIAFIEGMMVHHYGTSSYGKIDREEFGKVNYLDQVTFERKYGMEHKNLGWDKYMFGEVTHA